jgi:hypothetical protein
MSYDLATLIAILDQQRIIGKPDLADLTDEKAIRPWRNLIFAMHAVIIYVGIICAYVVNDV